MTIEHEQKSISHEKTFADVTSKHFLKEKLFKLTGKVCQELRDMNWLASTINIKLRYSDFKTLTRSRTIKPTDDDKTIFDTAWNMLMKAHTRRVAIRLVGISLSKFSKFSEQEELFEWDEVKRRIDDLAPGGGFVFNTVHNIQADVPPENIIAMWETLQKYGKY